MAKKQEKKVDVVPWAVKTNTGKVVKTGLKSFGEGNDAIRAIQRKNRENGLSEPILASVRA